MARSDRRIWIEAPSRNVELRTLVGRIVDQFPRAKPADIFFESPPRPFNAFATPKPYILS